MKNQALEEMACRAFCKIEEAQVYLESESRSRNIATLQGQIAGARALLDILQANLGVDLSGMEGEEPIDLAGLDDYCLGVYQAEIGALTNHPKWPSVEAAMTKYREILQQHLLFETRKYRDLDVNQGKEKCLQIPAAFMKAVNDEINRRIVEASKNKQPVLEFEQ